jgi:hypothetical protein
VPAPELESKIMDLIRGLKACAKVKGVSFVLSGASVKSRIGLPAHDPVASQRPACASSWPRSPG